MIDMTDSEQILFEWKISLIQNTFIKVQEEEYKRKEKEKEEMKIKYESKR